MEMRNLGSSGIAVSVLGVGCNAFGVRTDLRGTREIVGAALDVGVNFFDTADAYGPYVSEELLGQALGKRREQVVVATKFGMDLDRPLGWGPPASRMYIRHSVEGSLRRLRTDYIDLYQLHQPDTITPHVETLAALEELVDEGKIRAFGCSNFTPAEVRDAAFAAEMMCGRGYATAQNEYSLYNRTAEADLIPALAELEMGLLPYFPLAYGLLTGKYQNNQSAPEGSRLSSPAAAFRLQEADFGRVTAIEQFAQQRGLSMLEVAIGGLAAQRTVSSVIAGVSRASQVRENAQASAWNPTAEDLEVLDELNQAPSDRLTSSAYRR